MRDDSGVSTAMTQAGSKPRLLLVSFGVPMSAARLPAVFRRAGWEVHTLCPPWGHLHHSAFIDIRHPWPNEAVSSAPLDALARLASSGDWTKVLLADDLTLRTVTESGREDLLCLLPIDRTLVPPRLTFCKGTLAEWLPNRPGLIGPPTLKTCDADEAIAWWEANQFDRVIVKPVDGTAGRGIFVPHDKGELRAKWGNQPCVVQQLLQGERAILEWSMKDGQVRSVAYSIKARSNGPYGYSIDRLFQDGREALEVVCLVGEGTGFDGFGAGDFIRDSAGRFVVIELAFRQGSGITFSQASGVDHLQGYMDSKDSPIRFSVSGGRLNQFPEVLVGSLTNYGLRGLIGEALSLRWIRGAAWNDPPLLKRQFWEVRRAFGAWRSNRQKIK